MIGQKNLLSKLDKYTLDTFPHSVILLGENGSGKKEIVKYLAKHLSTPAFNLTLVRFDETVGVTATGQMQKSELKDYIDSIYRSTAPHLYLIPANALTEASQSPLLKFIEEPLNNAFVIITAENKYQVLNTIYNRCLAFEMDKYSEEELTQFLAADGKNDPELILKLARTPGQVMKLNTTDMTSLLALCDTIATKLGKANYANALSIVNKINYKDEADKFDLDIFLDTLSFTLFNKYLSENNKTILNMYLLLADERKKLSDGRLSKQIFMEHLITLLWKESKNEY